MRLSPPDVRVLHRDATLLVLEKPAFVPTTSPDAQATTLVSLAQALDPEAEVLHPSSRLDAEVTGVVVFARTRAAIQQLLAARSAGRYARGYLGLAGATPAPAAGEWHAAIALDPRDPRRRAARPGKDGQGARPKGGRRDKDRVQEAHTRYRTLASLPQAALLWLEPLTGRTHQLRVHAAHAGCALLGDRAYGGAGRIVLPDGRVVTPRRALLHCARVNIPNPSGPGDLRFEAPPPADFMQVFTSLGGGPIELPRSAQ